MLLCIVGGTSGTILIQRKQRVLFCIVGGTSGTILIQIKQSVVLYSRWYTRCKINEQDSCKECEIYQLEIRLPHHAIVSHLPAC